MIHGLITTVDLSGILCQCLSPSVTMVTLVRHVLYASSSPVHELAAYHIAESPGEVNSVSLFFGRGWGCVGHICVTLTELPVFTAEYAT